MRHSTLSQYASNNIPGSTIVAESEDALKFARALEKIEAAQERKRDATAEAKLEDGEETHH